MRRVLVIDDDPDIRTVINILLNKAGYEVETASRKDEVFDKIDAFKPGIILLDVLLSGYDGRKICRQIKNSLLNQRIQVIMFSAHPGAAENIASYGADDFIAKPLSTERLLAKIEQQFGLVN